MSQLTFSRSKAPNSFEVVSGNLTLTNGAFLYNSSNFSLRASTSDAADTQGAWLCGGGANNTGRGALILLAGNERSTTNGILTLSAGDAASAYVGITAPSSTLPTIRFTLTATEHLRLETGFVFSNMVAGNESTAAGVPLLGANCPATTLSAPFKWFKVKTQDGSTAYIPAWK
jgi:hypothetical protein